MVAMTLVLCLGLRDMDLKRLVGFAPKGEIVRFMVGA